MALFWSGTLIRRKEPVLASIKFDECIIYMHLEKKKQQNCSKRM